MVTEQNTSKNNVYLQGARQGKQVLVNFYEKGNRKEGYPKRLSQVAR